MDNNTNQNVNQNTTQAVQQQAAPEIKTEEVATKKEKKPKEKKEKKPKEPKEPMDKEDQKWYALAMLFLVLAFLPTLCRNLDPNYDEFRYVNDDKEEEKDPEEIERKTLMCNKTVTQSDYSYLVEITSAYEDGEPVNTSITYTVSVDSSSTIDINTIEITEFKTIEGILESGVFTNESDVTTQGDKKEKVYTVELNYKTNSSLLEKEELDGHNKIYSVQKNNYTNDSYSCVLE